MINISSPRSIIDRQTTTERLHCILLVSACTHCRTVEYCAWHSVCCVIVAATPKWRKKIRTERRKKEQPMAWPEYAERIDEWTKSIDADDSKIVSNYLCVSLNEKTEKGKIRNEKKKPKRTRTNKQQLNQNRKSKRNKLNTRKKTEKPQKMKN